MFKSNCYIVTLTSKYNMVTMKYIYFSFFPILTFFSLSSFEIRRRGDIKIVIFFFFKSH